MIYLKRKKEIILWKLNVRQKYLQKQLFEVKYQTIIKELKRAKMGR